jgi:hypothetical protein
MKTQKLIMEQYNVLMSHKNFNVTMISFYLDLTNLQQSIDWTQKNLTKKSTRIVFIGK